MRPASGAITFRGERIDGLPLENVALMGIRYVYQDKRVFGELTVRENIELAAYPTGQSLHEAISKVLAIHPKMELLLDSKAKGLSGGERQILLIGRALIGNPQALVGGRTHGRPRGYHHRRYHKDLAQDEKPDHHGSCGAKSRYRSTLG